MSPGIATPARTAGHTPNVSPIPRLDLAVLTDIAVGLSRAEDLWGPHLVHDTEERTRVRLLATGAYEVWLLGWAPGQSAGLHHHGGSNGAFVVVDGELTETVAVGGAHPSARRLAEKTLGPGDLGTIGAGAVHDLGNRSTAVATSIHAYSQPLRSMGFYDDAEPGVRGHRIRTVWVDGAAVTQPGELRPG